ncbi:MAG TPA: helix-turn-helix transcriptional regulator [Chitinophagaceae bacterium]|nr:helix-turn-helix transcriptional regulator [Chitinophagaceae bacterium]
MKKTEIQKKIGERIVELRTQLGWSQADLARACGKDRQAIEKLENGKVNPTVYSLYEVAKALETTVAKIITF